MGNYIPQTGDVILTDLYSFRNCTGAKVVQFLCVAPTIWHRIVWKISGKKGQDKDEAFHVGMVYDVTRTIAQQRKVEIFKSGVILANNNCYIYRRKGLSQEQQLKLINGAVSALWYRSLIFRLFEKLLIRLTGLKLFTKRTQPIDTTMLVVRVVEWFFDVSDYGDDVKKSSVESEKIFKNYLKHDKSWELIYSPIK